MSSPVRRDSVATARVALRAAQVGAVLSVATLVLIFGTAGLMFPSGGPEDLHGTGAVALHVFSGLTVLGLALHRVLGSGGSWWPTVGAAIVFALGFVQASVGAYTSLDLHVPGALIVTAGSVWLYVWIMGAGRSRQASGLRT